MSRIGKRPVVLPSGVTASLDGATLTVKGAKASLTTSFAKSDRVQVETVEGNIVVKRCDESRLARQQQGLVRALIQNMVTGVSTGFTRELEIVGVGYRADVKGKKLVMSLGFSHPIDFEIPEGITVAVDKQTRVKVSGADRCLVGETAARIRRLRPPEPYKGKGVKYSDEVIKRKVGKTAGAAKTGA